MPGDEPPYPTPIADSPLPPSRLHPAWIAIGALRWLRALGLPLVLALLGGGDLFARGFYAVAAVLGLLVGAWQLLEWTRFRYEVIGGQLRVRSGLIRTQERLVPLWRIQAVDINESLVQRLLGVVGVKIETAAGGSRKSDVDLEALRRADAIALRDRLLAARRTPGATPDPTDAAGGAADAAVPALPATALIRALSTRDLLLAGVTSAQVGPAAALVVTAMQLADDVTGSPLPELLGIDARGFTLRGAALLLGLLAGGAWLLAIAGTVLTFAHFELRRDGDRLLIAHGLLDRRRRTVPLARIQAVRLQESPLRQPFGLASLRFESAGYARETGGSGVLFPLLPRAQAAALLAAACPAFALPGGETAFAPPPRRAMGRYVLGPAWWVAGATAAGALLAGPVVPGLAWSWALLGLILLPPALALGALRYRDSGWAFDEAGRFLVRGRALGRWTVVTSARRLQRREVRQNPLQRRAALATFRAAVASGGSGGGLGVRHLDIGTAFAVAERLAPHGLADAAVAARGRSLSPGAPGP